MEKPKAKNTIPIRNETISYVGAIVGNKSSLERVLW
jgi:hypothetical protein